MLCLPFATRAWSAGAPPAAPGEGEGRPQLGRGFACALGESADATLLPPARRVGLSLALALAGSARPAAEQLRELTGSRDAEWIELSPADRGGVDDGPLAERIRTAGNVTLIEGDVLDWLVTLWPARRSSAVLRALAECALTGGRLIGRGSTAMLVASGGVVRGATRDTPGEARLRSKNPRESGEPRLTQGLRLCGDFFVDTQIRSSGSVLRLLSTLIENHQDLGLYLGQRSVLCGDLETRGWTALGPDPLIALDVSRSLRRAESISSAHVSVLAAGDGWRASERRWFCSGATATFGAAQAKPVDGDGLLAANLRAPPLESRTSIDDRARVELRRAGDSLAFSGPGDAPARGQRMILDVELKRGSWGELGA